MVQGKILEFDPKKKLVYTFKLTAEPKAATDRESRVSYELEPIGDSTKLTGFTTTLTTKLLLISELLKVGLCILAT
ncbi:hypothetical protein AYB34_00680 [Leptospira sp. ZV016]|nr:hypothetical protein LEP1GSC198_3736 [Leptospira kirschneri str. JB]EMK06874.1 hypothetical protein LEP1GSC166_0334 [Leptospira kirschneri]KXZ24869.1 hypothetical protein AYB32_04065 [Leptospira kirschneri]KXZ33199.1 hypothetical protein AYB34_00680 [Leptospira sp. ZV016]